VHEARLTCLGPHGFHRIAYTDWGGRGRSRAVLCMHGLTRNSRDFDWLARALAPRFRVLCMDVAGRGRSDWLEHKHDYTFRLYQSDAAALIARVTEARAPWWRFGHAARDGQSPGAVDWVGTSMGGLVGMLLAAQPRSPIRRLVLNDVGPLIPWPALMRMKGYFLGHNAYASFDEAQALLRAACSTWGPLTEPQWRHLAEHSIRREVDGRYAFAFDPRIADATAWGISADARVGQRNLLGLELWSVWQQVRCPVLILRGKDSDVLREDTLRQMRQRDARTEVVEFAGVGHAPSLMSPEQIEPVVSFLSERQ
jgi:pimeloyl-ACP methyl ester carboxylesterase